MTVFYDAKYFFGSIRRISESHDYVKIKTLFILTKEQTWNFINSVWLKWMWWKNSFQIAVTS